MAKGDKRIISFDEIRQLLHDNAETGFVHTTYQEESRRFHYLINGDKRAIKESQRICNADLQGKLSDDPVRNQQYLFIINTGPGHPISYRSRYSSGNRIFHKRRLYQKSR